MSGCLPLTLGRSCQSIAPRDLLALVLTVFLGLFNFGKATVFFPLDEAEHVPALALGAKKSLKNLIDYVKLAIYQVLTRLELAGRKQ